VRNNIPAYLRAPITHNQNLKHNSVALFEFSTCGVCK